MVTFTLTRLTAGNRVYQTIRTESLIQKKGELTSSNVLLGCLLGADLRRSDWGSVRMEYIDKNRIAYHELEAWGHRRKPGRSYGDKWTWLGGLR